MRPAVLAAAVLAPFVLLPAGPASAQAYGQSYSQSGNDQAPTASDGRYDRGPAERPERAERPETPEPGDASQDLVRQLNLRGDQQAAYRDYQSAFQASGQGDDGGQNGGQDDIARLAAMTTPQRLDDSARQMDRDRADFERVAAATRRFYATLDPNQKRTFDRLTAPQAEPQDDGDDRGDDGGRAPGRAPAPQR